MTKEKERLITNYILTARNIKNLYDCMTVTNKDEIEDELFNQVVLEDLILQALDINQDNSKEIYREIKDALDSALLEQYYIELRDKKLESMMRKFKQNHRGTQEQENDLILKRFESALINRMRPIPIKSTKSGKSALVEDNATIRHAAKMDFYATTVSFLDAKKGSILEQEYALNARNQILFKEKEIESDYFAQELKTNRKQTCIDLGHDETLVDDIYYDYLTDKINEYGNRCYIYPNSALTEEKEKARFQTALTIFKAGLFMLDSDDVKEITMNYDCTFMNTQKESVTEIKKAMKEVIALQEPVKEQSGPVLKKKLGE